MKSLRHRVLPIALALASDACSQSATVTGSPGDAAAQPPGRA